MQEKSTEWLGRRGVVKVYHEQYLCNSELAPNMCKEVVQGRPVERSVGLLGFCFSTFLFFPISLSEIDILA